MSLTRVCSLSEIPDTNVLGVEVDGEPVAVVRDGDGTVHAINNVCTHQYVLLSEGEVEDGTIECWLHGARFDLGTGRPLTLPATVPVAVYDTRVEGDDVYVDVTAGPRQNVTAHATKEH